MTDKLQEALDQFDASIDKFNATPITVAHSTRPGSRPSGIDHAAFKAALLKGAIKEFVAKHRAYGYGWFLEVQNADQLLKHEEFCQDVLARDMSVAHQSSLMNGFVMGANSYWRAFKSKDDAAAFMLAFDATNLLPEVSFDEENW